MTYQPLHYRTDVGRPTIWSRLARLPHAYGHRAQRAAPVHSGLYSIAWHDRYGNHRTVNLSWSAVDAEFTRRVHMIGHDRVRVTAQRAAVS